MTLQLDGASVINRVDRCLAYLRSESGGWTVLEKNVTWARGSDPRFFLCFDWYQFYCHGWSRPTPPTLADKSSEPKSH
ncbi:MAG: hypothetical protein VKJ46_14155, partial [Leptolyngbyaceae bacterium]|nr:hypothetical protein [Leptolyngbyaceae bacterium]